MTHSFPAEHRIKRKKEFTELFHKSFRIYGNFFVYRIILTNQNYSKIGLIVSKKFGNAVYRNSLKRMIRECFRKKQFPISIHILVSQSRPFSDPIKAKKELAYVFSCLQDKFLMLQLSLSESTPLKNCQYSQKMYFPAQCCFYLLYFYRKYISKSLPSACRFTPSCSLFAMEAFRVWGFIQGMFLTLKRLLFCHPFGKSGYDPVPKRKRKK